MKQTVYILAAIAILGILAIYMIPEKNVTQSSSEITDIAQSTKTDTTLATDAESVSQDITVTNTMQNGVFTGDVARNQFGNVEVAITVEDGTISNVDTLQIPNNDSRSRQISEYAVDILIDRTLTAQSSDIDTVSGATYTSLSYIDSLQSAIDQAKQ